MKNLISFALILPLTLVIFISFYGVNAVNLQYADLQEAKFIALENGVLVGGITPTVQDQVEAYLEGKGYDRSKIDWTGSTLVAESGPFISLNNDIVVVLSYPRQTLLDVALDFFGITDTLPDRLQVYGKAKSQYVP